MLGGRSSFYYYLELVLLPCVFRIYREPSVFVVDCYVCVVVDCYLCVLVILCAVLVYYCYCYLLITAGTMFYFFV
jgi:hypothetical protein